MSMPCLFQRSPLLLTTITIAKYKKGGWQSALHVFMLWKARTGRDRKGKEWHERKTHNTFSHNNIILLSSTIWTMRTVLEPCHATTASPTKCTEWLSPLLWIHPLSSRGGHLCSCWDTENDCWTNDQLRLYYYSIITSSAIRKLHVRGKYCSSPWIEIATKEMELCEDRILLCSIGVGGLNEGGWGWGW